MTVARARTMRRDMTDAERRVWTVLRDRRLGGFKFRRQYPVAPCVLDFYSPEAGLAIEVDGGQHAILAALAQQRSGRSGAPSPFPLPPQAGGEGIRGVSGANLSLSPTQVGERVGVREYRASARARRKRSDGSQVLP
jgi:hypothetical protein